ncbi:MAG: 50S ribosomal protein L16 [Candidatus Caenarcaniphilales bacterium]|nr:50S ribosomal protein L16 [Candidatus Caenarcaniphilales bacterium]
MLMPKRTKFRKQMRGRRKGLATRCNKLDFGTIGLKSLDPEWITSQQIEAARRCLSRLVRKNGQLWIRIFPDKVRTQKAAETRQGGGKGNPEGWVAVVKPGTVLFEMEGIDIKDAEEALRLAGHKLPVRTKIIFAEGV